MSIQLYPTTLKLIMSLAVVFSSNSLLTQELYPQWISTIGGTSNDEGRCIAFDQAGNLLIGGLFQDDITIETSEGTSQFSTSYQGCGLVTKLTPMGQIIWSKQLGSNNRLIINAISTDAEGAIYTSGFFDGQSDFDPSNSEFIIDVSPSQICAFLCKWNTDGTFLWAKHFIGSSLITISSSDVDVSGNIYCTGYFRETADFDPSEDEQLLTSGGGDNGFVLKLSTEGNLVWSRQLLCTAHSNCNSINVDPNGTIVIGGNFTDTCDFDPDEESEHIISSNEFSNSYIWLLNTDGEYESVINSWANDQSRILDVCFDVQSNVIAIGEFQSDMHFNADGDVQLMSIGGRDVFFVKYDQEGEVLWSRQVGSLANEWAFGINTDHLNNVYALGSYSNGGTISSGQDTIQLPSAQSLDVFILKFNSDGEQESSTTFGGLYWDEPYEIILDQSGNAYCTGYFSEQIDQFTSLPNTPILSNGDGDMFILKLGSTPLSDLERPEQSIQLFPNPTSGELHIELSSPEKICIFSIDGKLVETSRIASRHEIDLSHYPSGTYILKCQYEHFKFIKI